MTSTHSIEHNRKPVQLSDVKNKEQHKHAKRITKQLKHSYWHLIINTNQRYNAESLELITECKRLKNAADEFLTVAKIGECIQFLIPEHKWDTNWIKKLSTDGAVERAPGTDQVHCHLMICIDHYSKIRLNSAKVKEHFMKHFPELKNLFIRYKVVRARSSFDPVQYLTAYIHKNEHGHSNSTSEGGLDEE